VRTDIEIAQEAALEPITSVGGRLGIPEEELDLYGRYKAKVSLSFAKEAASRPKGKLILVTATTPTALGEGKTTVTIGLGQALAQKGRRTAICLREPSLGPCFGIKGGAAGGGYSQVLPMEDINLHLRETSTPSVLPTICSRRWWTITSSRATSWIWIPAGSSCVGWWT